MLQSYKCGQMSEGRSVASCYRITQHTEASDIVALSVLASLRRSWHMQIHFTHVLYADVVMWLGGVVVKTLDW